MFPLDTSMKTTMRKHYPTCVVGLGRLIGLADRQNFSFKCHRRDQSPTSKDQTLVYAVNAISFHQEHGTFSTAGKCMRPKYTGPALTWQSRDSGSDGTINFWDKDSRTRLKSVFSILWDLIVFLRPSFSVLTCFAAFDPAPGPIVATGFNRTGNIYAYAISYDWSKGHSGMVPGHPNKIMLHPCKEEEVKRRPRK